MRSFEFSKISFLLGAGLLFVLGCQPVEKTGDRIDAPTLPFQPNILWIVAEDLGPYIPPFGDLTVETPNLSRLAAEGVRYPNLFSPSGVCAPSRAAIATGMYPTRIGATHMRTGPWYRGHPGPERILAEEERLPEGVVPYEALPPPGTRMHSEYLRLAGYYAANSAKEDYQFLAPVTAWDESAPGAHWRDRAPGQPFFSIVNIEVTHESRIWGKREDSLWIDPQLPVPVPPYLPDTEIALRDIRRMYSNIVEMDVRVGELLAQLEQDALLDSTIVFWYTDHGGPLPRQKRTVFDSGLRSPMMIRFPGQANAGSVDDQLLSFIDLKPTILSLAGIEPPQYVDGQAFLGPFRATEERRYIHAAGDRFDSPYDGVRAVRDRRFKYIRHLKPELPYYVPVEYRERMPIMQELLRLRDSDALSAEQALWFRETRPQEELFDTDSDPHELRNLAQLPEQAGRLRALRAEADRWMAATSDMGIMPEPEYLASIWPDGRQPQTADPVAEWSDTRLVLRSATAGASIGFKILPVALAPTGSGSRMAEGLTSESAEDGTSVDVSGIPWRVYSQPLQIADNMRVIAVAHRIGYLPSPSKTFFRAP